MTLRLVSSAKLREFGMVGQARLFADFPYDPVSSLAGLSLDELRFLPSCHERWFELDPAEAAAIIKAARRLIADLFHGSDDAVVELRAVAS
jgi:hypothetical protein